MEDIDNDIEEAGVQKSGDRYWNEIMNIKTAVEQKGLPALAQVMVAILRLPHIIADCERAFSVVRKVQTECRQRLNGDMLTALLQCKLNNDRSSMSFVYQMR